MRANCSILFFILVLAVIPQAAWSQGTTSLSGNVTDTTGAVIPGAEITLTNPATNATRTTTTNEIGAYVFAQVPPGTYKVEFKRDGFTTVVRGNVVLPIGTPQVLSVSLSVGQTTENVT